MSFEERMEILDYIRAWPDRFFDSLEEYIISEYKPAEDMLSDYADWHSEDFEEWRRS